MGYDGDGDGDGRTLRFWVVRKGNDLEGEGWRFREYLCSLDCMLMRRRMLA